MRRVSLWGFTAAAVMFWAFALVKPPRPARSARYGRCCTVAPAARTRQGALTRGHSASAGPLVEIGRSRPAKDGSARCDSSGAYLRTSGERSKVFRFGTETVRCAAGSGTESARPAGR